MDSSTIYWISKQDYAVTGNMIVINLQLLLCNVVEFTEILKPVKS